MAQLQYEQQLIPGLPNDLAFLCLKRLPWEELERAGAVCVAWRYALGFSLKAPWMSSRLQQQVRMSMWRIPRPAPGQPLVFICCAKDGYVIKGFDAARLHTMYAYFLLDPVAMRCYRIPPPLDLNNPNMELRFETAVPVGNDVLFHIQAQHCQYRGTPDQSFHSFRLDVVGRNWYDYEGAGRALKCASATLEDGSTCLAGGITINSNQVSVDALRFVPDASVQWQGIGRMRELHNYNAGAHMGLVLNGCFWVIDKGVCMGGVDVWNPVTGEWSYIPDMWPSDLFKGEYACPAVVGGRLYALRGFKSHDILAYNHSDRTWSQLCSMPPPPSPNLEYSSLSLAKLRGVGKELWLWLPFEMKPGCRPPNTCQIDVAHFHRPMDMSGLLAFENKARFASIFTINPTQYPLEWKLLPLSFPTSLLCWTTTTSMAFS